MALSEADLQKAAGDEGGEETSPAPEEKEDKAKEE
jgi:hypothetical protein